MTRFLLSLTALCLSLCAPLVSYAQEIVTYAGCKFQIDAESRSAIVIGRESDAFKEVGIPYSVRSTSLGLVPVAGIANDAFKNCSTLTTVNFDFDHIDNYTEFKYIGASAFEGCTGLTEINDLPDDIEEFGNNAFSGCTSLINMWLPASLTTLGDGAFANCNMLEVVYVNNELTTIGSKAFYGCSAMTSFYCNNNTLKIIGQSAFDGCSSMTTVSIQHTLLKAIGIGIFQSCTSLTSVELPNTIKNIGLIAFNNCPALKSINIPNSVTSIGMMAFRGSGLQNISLPPSVKTIESLAFQNCKYLKSVNIPNSVVSLGNQSFSGCTNLADATIGTLVTNIGSQTFSKCSSLNTVIIGTSVKNIGSKAFEECTNLKNINCYAETPPSVDDDAFLNVALGNVMLGIPSSSQEAYTAATTWKEFKGYDTFEIDGRCAKPTITFENGTISATSSTPGAQCNICYKIITSEEDDSEEDTAYLMEKMTISLMSGMGLDLESLITGKSYYGIGSAAPVFKLKVEAYATAENLFNSETTTAIFDLSNPGDIDGDGEISVEDVTKLVNKILNK